MRSVGDHSLNERNRKGRIQWKLHGTFAFFVHFMFFIKVLHGGRMWIKPYVVPVTCNHDLRISFAPFHQCTGRNVVVEQFLCRRHGFEDAVPKGQQGFSCSPGLRIETGLHRCISIFGLHAASAEIFKIISFILQFQRVETFRCCQCPIYCAHMHCTAPFPTQLYRVARLSKMCCCPLPFFPQMIRRFLWPAAH